MLDKIIFFIYVVRCNSFSEAAKCYGISTSAGSRWILELEKQIGVSLLKRTTRKVIPTQAGLRLYECFDSINQEIDDVLNEIQSINNQTCGLIKIAATPLFARHYLAEIIGLFLIQYPYVTFKIVESAVELDMIEHVDFCILAAANYAGHREKDSLLVKRVLTKAPLITCCSPAYLERHDEPKVPQDLYSHNCLYASTLVGGNRWIFAHNNEQVTVEITQTVEVENSIILKEIAMHGGGIAYLPLTLIKQELEDGTLVEILEEFQTSYFEFSLYYRPRKQIAARHENFKKFLIEQTNIITERIYSGIKSHSDYL
ncbi:MAG: LysR family transcriptional regulator [Enterobacteriaceae bacterium]|jgi:DNA-binding transcriptional LysR family regulator|nr:LysR family transcriptional regulator [Enterobacteriaceae bacterium]